MAMSPEAKVSNMPMSSFLRSTSPMNFFGRPLCPVLGPAYKYLSLTSSRKRLMRLNPRLFSPVTKLSLEKKASATIHLDIEISSSLSELMVLRYCPTREFGLSICFKYSGTRPRLFLLNVCFAIMCVPLVASASTRANPINSRPHFIEEAQPDQK